MNRRAAGCFALIGALGSCGPSPETPLSAPEAVAGVPERSVASEEPEAKQNRVFSLVELRKTWTTSVAVSADREPAPEPPGDVFEKVTYPGPLGDYVAYVSPAEDGARRPAIVWIPGGFDWGIGQWLWEPAPRENDQTARAFRDAGIVLMLPALRGSNENPGHNECFGGEVEDVLAAAEFVASRPDVDPDRVYIGGHSTGGTLALLALEMTDRFRAGFSFGPVTHPIVYGEHGCLPPGVDEVELEVRAPIRFVSEIVTPTFVIEGTYGNSNMLPVFEASKLSAPVTVIEVLGASHFDVLAPATEVIAAEILRDEGPRASIRIDTAVLSTAMAR